MILSEWGIWLLVFFGFLQTALLFVIAYRLRGMVEIEEEDQEVYIS